MTEVTRYEINARYFRGPLCFAISPPTIRDPYSNPREDIPLSTLPTSFVQNFHFKDTALYCLADCNREPIFDVVWKTWYPRRNTAMERNPDAFFCRSLRRAVSATGAQEEVGLDDLVGFHEELVRVADANEEDRKKLREQGGKVSKAEKVNMRAAGLEDTFRKAIVVLDKEDWEKDGVLVICRKESAEEFGLQQATEEEVESLAERGWVAYRKGLAEAVETVICDPERKKAEAPIDERFRAPKFSIF